MDETVDYIAIRRLQDRYADVCTRQAWPELHDLLLTDARVVLDLRDREIVLDGPDALGDFIGTQLEQFSFFQFAIRTAVVDLYGDSGTDLDIATGRMWISEFRCHRDDGHWSTIFGLYEDHYRRSADGWRFAGRRYRSVARPDTGEIFPLDLG